MPNDAYERSKMLLNVDENAKILIESDSCANVRFFGRMNVSSHRWSPFHPYFLVITAKGVFILNISRTKADDLLAVRF